MKQHEVVNPPEKCLICGAPRIGISEGRVYFKCNNNCLNNLTQQEPNLTQQEPYFLSFNIQDASFSDLAVWAYKAQEEIRRLSLIEKEYKSSQCKNHG